MPTKKHSMQSKALSIRHRFKQQTVTLRNSLNKLVDEWRENRDMVSREASEKLAGGIESFVEEQDSWKKKQDYE